jgi:hypothetical protein
MDPISGIVEEKAVESAWALVRGWWNRNRDLKMRVEALEAQLAAERSPKLELDRLLCELVCHSDDDNMYWKKDGSGPYCPLCLCDKSKLIPLTHGTGEGSYYCRLHEHYFETQERRERVRNHTPRSRSWPSIKRRLEAESYREAHQQNWMR